MKKSGGRPTRIGDGKKKKNTGKAGKKKLIPGLPEFYFDFSRLKRPLLILLPVPLIIFLVVLLARSCECGKSGEVRTLGAVMSDSIHSTIDSMPEPEKKKTVKKRKRVKKEPKVPPDLGTTIEMITDE